MCIPIALGLPRALGDIRGNAVLTATNEDGLEFDSLRIVAPHIPLGPAIIENLDVSYSGGGDAWNGKATIGLPPQPGGVKLGGEVRFAQGAFKGAAIIVSPPHPGLPLFTGVYLRSFGGGFFVDPLTVQANATIGALPLAAGHTVSRRRPTEAQLRRSRGLRPHGERQAARHPDRDRPGARHV